MAKGCQKESRRTNSMLNPFAICLPYFCHHILLRFFHFAVFTFRVFNFAFLGGKDFSKQNSVCCIIYSSIKGNDLELKLELIKINIVDKILSFARLFEKAFQDR